MEQKWYPTKPLKKRISHRKIVCIVCDGKAEVIDRRTGFTRKCCACKKGVIILR